MTNFVRRRRRRSLFPLFRSLEELIAAAAVENKTEINTNEMYESAP